MAQTGFERDLPTRLQLIASGQLASSDIDARRRGEILRRRPEKFARLSDVERMNFVAYGIPYEDGQLDEWLSQHWPLPRHRNLPALGKGGAFLLDHLPRRSMAFPPITVPWTGCRYVGMPGKFHEYPGLMGFDIEDLLNGSFGLHSDEEGMAFLQSWLFFGLLSEALAGKCKIIYKWWVKDYESPEVTAKSMMSPLLPKYLDLFSQRLSDIYHRPPWEHWDSVFKTTLAVAEKFETRFAKQAEPEDDPVSLKITWSILTLGQMLTVIAMRSYQIEDAFIEQWPDSSILDNRLARKHLCPHLIARLKTTLSMDTLYLLSLIPWHNPVNPYAKVGSVTESTTMEQDRGESNSAEKANLGRHQQCSFQICNAENIDYDLYRTAHVMEGCECNFIGPEIAEVYRILDKKEIPVLVINQTIDGNGVIRLSLNVLSSRSTSGYVAISHVWADGLGNQYENKLPQCQVSRIAQLLRDLTEKHTQAFWIDTCCVPRDEKQRWKALDLMNDTYRLSDHVLVLDATLQQYKSYRVLDASLHRVDVEIAEQVRMGITVDLLLRIVCSSWTTRLWTLPEGQVGPLLHLQFFDGAVELGDLYAQLRTWPFIGTSLVDDLRSFLVRLRPRLRTQSAIGQGAEDPALLQWPGGTLDGRFIAMLHAIEWRDTSRKIDEVLCLAIQLKLNVSSVQNCPKEEGMQALLEQINLLPSDLMFTHGPRIETYPFRWAPRTLIGYKDHYSFVPAAKADTPMGQRTDRGLRVKYPSFQISRGRVPDSQFLFFSSRPVDSRGGFTSTSDSARKHFGMMIDHSDPRYSPSWREGAIDALDGDGDLLVIIGFNGFHGAPATQDPGKVCLIIVKEREEDQTIFGRPLQTVVVFEMPPDRVPNDVPGGGTSIWHGVQFPPRTFCIG